jgi:hypothetical protein
MTSFLIILGFILLGLALPAATRGNFLPRLFIAMFMSFMVVVLPLFVFFFSSFMVPEWKGECRHGWLDCFIVSKLALTPFVLTATAALYGVEVLGIKNGAKKWMALAIYLGALVSVVCLIFGLVCIGFPVWMWVPFYVATWYSIRAIQLAQTAPLKFWNYFWVTACSIPFWVLSWFWSLQIYKSLPDKAPDGCFIVTAAARGHGKFVGPFFEIKRNGRRIFANQQLFTLWQFENLWRSRSPRSHRNFRRIYNRFGPFIAAQIKSPWLADLVFIAIKPAEIAARFFIHNPGGNHEPHKMD